MNNRISIALIGLVLGGYSCAKPANTQMQPTPKTTGESKFVLKSAAFADGSPLPTKFTCDGVNVSPALEWIGIPKGTKSLVLTCLDPDAPMGTFTHWIVYNIPPTTTKLAENLAKKGEVAGGIRQGKNDFGKLGYGGACPPAGAAHRYQFQLSALKVKLTLKPGATLEALEKAIGESRIGEAEYIGTYQRK